MLLSTLVLASAGAGQFITLGDWGGMALAKDPSKQYVADTTTKVAKQMATCAADNDVQFIINTGDNF